MLTRIKTLATTLLLAGAIALPTWACNPSDCQTVMEQEPNGFEQPQMVGSVDQGTCLTISGAITTGYDNFDQPNPSMDNDAFVLQVPPGTHFQVTYGSIDQTDEFLWMWRDARNNVAIELQCGNWQEDGTVRCEGISPSDVLATAFASRLPEDYTITIALGGNPAPAPIPGPGPLSLRSGAEAASYASNGAELQALMDRLR